MKFADVQLGDALIMQTGRYDDLYYYRVTVTKVTKTRFTTSGQGNVGPQEWTKDGDLYPRNKDPWSFSCSQLHVPSEELSTQITHTNAVRAANKRLRLFSEQVENFYRHNYTRLLSLEDIGALSIAMSNFDLILQKHLPKEKTQE
jgi:hypothetical protein